MVEWSGSKYKHLLVTRDGKTPKDPFNWFGDPDDYDAWYDVVDEIGEDVFDRWNRMLHVEDELASKPLDPKGPQGVYPHRDLILELLLNFKKDWDDIPHVVMEPFDVDWEHPLGNLTWEPGIRNSIAVAERGTQLMEGLDEAVEYYGRSPLPAPVAPAEGADKLKKEQEEKKEPGIGSALLAIGGVVGGWFVWKRWPRKKKG